MLTVLRNVSGAVTLLNSAVTGKVLTGLPTPAAGNIQAGDSILEAFGKLQSQVSSISNGLIFKGSWDADTNTPTLTSGGGEVDSGTTTGQAANKLIQSGQNFNTTITVGDKVINQVDGTTALVTVIDSNTQLSLNADIMLSGEAYTIDASPFIQQGNYYVVNYAGTTNLNGNNSWSIGDWVIADADNRWSKLDHSQVDGQGTIGNLPVFATATTIGDSIVAQSGTALTVTGSLTTTLGASVTGDFSVNTNKFTVNATSGNTVVAGDLSVTGGDLTLGSDSVASNINGVGDVLGINVDSNTGGGAGANIQLKTAGTTQLTINSSSATFAGDVQAPGIYVGATNASFDFYNQGTSYFNGAVTVDATLLISGVSNYTGLTIRATSSARPGINFENVTQGALGTIFGTESRDVIIGTGASGVTALTLDSSQNATFAGNVGLGGTGLYTSSHSLNIDGTGLAIKNNVNGSSNNWSVIKNTASSSGSNLEFYTSTGKVKIDSFGNTTFGDFTYGSSLGQVRIINNASSSPASLSLMGFDNVADGGNYAKIDLAMQSSGTGGQVVSSIRGLAVGTGENASDLAFYTATGGTLAEKMRIDSSGNVGIGTESPDQTGYGYKTLTIMGGTNAGDSGVIELLSPSVDAEGQNMGIVSFGAGGTRTGMISANRQGANNAANLRFWTSAGSGIIERMRISSAGVLTVGGQTNTRIVTTITENDKVDLNVADGTNTTRNLTFSTGGTQRMRLTADGELRIGTGTGANAKLHVVNTDLNRKTLIEGNGSNQGTAQKSTIVNHYPVVSAGSQLIIPFTSQGNLNSTTIIKIWGHSARFNSNDPRAFEATIQVGHLNSLFNVSALSSSGNISGVSTSGMNLIISFTTAYTNPSLSDGVYATIEYMTNNLSYSLIPSSIVMN